MKYIDNEQFNESEKWNVLIVTGRVQVKIDLQQVEQMIGWA